MNLKEENNYLKQLLIDNGVDFEKSPTIVSEESPTIISEEFVKKTIVEFLTSHDAKDTITDNSMIYFDYDCVGFYIETYKIQENFYIMFGINNISSLKHDGENLIDTEFLNIDDLKNILSEIEDIYKSYKDSFKIINNVKSQVSKLEMMLYDKFGNNITLEDIINNNEEYY